MNNIRFAKRAIVLTVFVASQAAVCLQVQQAKDIYPSAGDARKEIKLALAKAAKENKRIILDFGGNWCGDCRALNTLFHKEPNASFLKANFILVDVNIGKFDANVDIAKHYDVPLNKGVPALAVLGSKGNLIYSQKNGEFESMGTMDPSSVTTFLTHWKG